MQVNIKNLIDDTQYYSHGMRVVLARRKKSAKYGMGQGGAKIYL